MQNLHILSQNVKKQHKMSLEYVAIKGKTRCFSLQSILSDF